LRLLGKDDRQIGGLVSEMVAPVAQCGDLLQEAQVLPGPNGDGAEGDILGRDLLLDHFPYPLLVFGVGAIGQEDDVAHGLVGIGQVAHSCLETFAHIDAAAASLQADHPLDHFLPQAS